MTRSRFIRTAGHAFNAAALLASAAAGAFFWNRLPARVPMHYGADGLPNQWGDKFPEALLLIAMPWIVTAIVYAALAFMPWLRRHPKWINMPRKAEFMALAPEDQGPFFDLLMEFPVVIAAGCNLLFVSILAGTLRIALGYADRLSPWVGIPQVVFLFTVAIIYTIRMLTWAPPRGWPDRNLPLSK